MKSIRPGTTLAELMLTLGIISILAAIAVPRAGRMADRMNVKGAAQDVVLTIAAARAAASGRDGYSSFVADPRTGRVRAVSGGEILLARDLSQSHGVRLEASRESVTFAPGGLGWGAANTTVIVSRGSAADTVVMARLGRVRW